MRPGKDAPDRGGLVEEIQLFGDCPKCGKADAVSDFYQQRFEQSMRRAQAAYDNQEPPELHTDEDGHCEHKWRAVRSNEHGTLLRCRYCDEEDVQ